MPTSPGFRSVEFSMNDSVSESQSPFTQQTQVQAWPGADWWEGTVTLPPLTRVQAAQWISFLMALRGKANVFQLGDPMLRIPQGVPQGTPVANSTIITNTNKAMQSQIVISGLTPNAPRCLLPGDQVQVGYRLHTLLNVINADTSGQAIMDICPSIREDIVDGTPIITHDAKGLFRLATNKRTWSVDYTRLYGLSFQIKEAR